MNVSNLVFEMLSREGPFLGKNGEYGNLRARAGERHEKHKSKNGHTKLFFLTNRPSYSENLLNITDNSVNLYPPYIVEMNLLNILEFMMRSIE